MLRWRHVRIRWYGETEWQKRTVVVGDESLLTDADEDVFFYFENEDDYEDCLAYGETDFEMME